MKCALSLMLLFPSSSAAHSAAAIHRGGSLVRPDDEAVAFVKNANCHERIFVLIQEKMCCGLPSSDQSCGVWIEGSNKEGQEERLEVVCDEDLSSAKELT